MKKINFTKWALTLALSGFTFFSALAADIYVSSAAADDNGDGTQENPVLTLAKAYQLIGGQTGSTIYVSGAVSANTTGNGLDLNGISITVEGIEGSGAGITGDSIRLFYVRNNAVLTLKNLHLAGNPDKSLVGQGGCISIFQGNGLFVENVTFENFSTALNPVNDPDNGGNLNNDTGAGGVVFVNQLSGNDPVLSFKNCQFKNNSTTGNWGGGVMRVQDFGNVTNPHVYFENCGFYGNTTFRGNPGGSVIVVRAGSATTSQISFVNSTITACGAGGSGIIAFSSANTTLNVINSTIKDNPVSGIICWEQSNSILNIYNSVIENNAGANMNDVRFSEKAGTAVDSAKINVNNSLIGNPLWRNVPAEKIPYVKPAEYTVGSLFDDLDETSIIFKPEAGSFAINYGDAQYLTALNIDYDQSGNIRSFENDKCDAGAIEYDKIAPLITPEAADSTVEYDAETNPAALEAWLDDNGGAVASDASEIAWTNDFDEDNWVTDEGNNKHILVTFTVTDINGNAATTAATFSIEDTTPPVITTEAADVTVEYDAETNPTALEAWLDDNGGAVASDAGEIAWTNDFDEDNWVADAGNGKHILVTFTVTDINGNAATTAATFTIDDNGTKISKPSSTNVLSISREGRKLIIRANGQVGESVLISLSGQTISKGFGNEISLAAAGNGVYILRVEVNGETENHKIVLTKLN